MIAELDENGSEKSTGVLLSGVLEVEKEVSHMCRPSGGDAFDILNDCGASDGQYYELG